MATQKQLESAAAKLGAEIDTDFSEHSYTLWSPSGFTWSETGTHAVARQFRNEGQSWKPEARQWLVEVMADGLQTCEQVDCDICNEN